MKNVVRDKAGRIFGTTEIVVNGILPNAIFDFILNLDKQKYIAWHPADHKDFRIIKQSLEIKGNIIFFEELIGGKYKIAHEWQIIDFKENEMLYMKAKIFIPVFLKLTFMQENQNTIVTHQLQIGFKGFSLLNNLIKKITFSNDRQTISDKHAKEEFKNLETLLSATR